MEDLLPAADQDQGRVPEGAAQARGGGRCGVCGGGGQECGPKVTAPPAAARPLAPLQDFSQAALKPASGGGGAPRSRLGAAAGGNAGGAGGSGGSGAASDPAALDPTNFDAGVREAGASTLERPLVGGVVGAYAVVWAGGRGEVRVGGGRTEPHRATCPLSQSHAPRARPAVPPPRRQLAPGAGPGERDPEDESADYSGAAVNDEARAGSGWG
jgi:hypothetical protein